MIELLCTDYNKKATFIHYYLSNAVLAPCKLEQIREMIIWQFTVIGGLPYFCGKMGVYVVIYRCKDKNTTQGNLAELVGSPVAPIWCK